MVRRIITAVVAVTGVAMGASAIAAQPAPNASIYGTWINPYHSVAVRTVPCANRLCGRVVWASREAQQDARDGNVPNLIGTSLLENYRPTGARSWAGTVFVPDMGRHFYSLIEQVDDGTMRVRGCILHGLLCKSQLWQRIADVPRG
ncbi:DUF2147 domain-containing protein [Sphingomonas sp. RHCKR47]|uniref:DUF2147 domain-containing protein n=1 Tax=Sphingomonas citricola TaxID=2862498 RepID=UPI001C68487B|nr:DUF2147 domain-containing protein [Sphingomonas citricola]MBW6523630.1 DUF2147 domain-containing protein [Sphingomonas citricola]